MIILDTFVYSSWVKSNKYFKYYIYNWDYWEADVSKLGCMQVMVVEETI